MKAHEIGNKLNIDWNRFDVEQFRMGLEVELEHGLNEPATDVTGNEPIPHQQNRACASQRVCRLLHMS